MIRKYNKGDIVCVWVAQNYIINFPKNPHVLQGFGKVISTDNYWTGKDQGLNYVWIEWIKIHNRKYKQDELDNRAYKFIKERCTLLIKAKDITGTEDWKSLLTLALLKR